VVDGDVDHVSLLSTSFAHGKHAPTMAALTLQVRLASGWTPQVLCAPHRLIYPLCLSTSAALTD
jgi:hypothetical protein